MAVASVEMDAPLPDWSGARRGLDLASQVGYFLEDQGETRPVPILGGFVAEAHPGDCVHVFWRLPGPPVFLAARRRRNLRRYVRLLRSWGMATQLHLDRKSTRL